MSPNWLLFVFSLLNQNFVQTHYVNIFTFQNKMIEAINSIRTMHGVSSLHLSQALSNTAQLYASKLAVLDIGLRKDFNDLMSCGVLISSIENSPISSNTDLICGESLLLNAASSGNNTDYCDANYITQLWNSERLNYNYTNINNNYSPPNAALDFTQLVW